MKKIFILLFAMTLALASCGAQKTKTIGDDTFSLQVPVNLKTFDYDIDCGKIFAIGDLRLLEFEQCWKDSSKVEIYGFEETYELFRKKFTESKNAKLTSEVLPDHRIVETVNYTELNNDYLFQPEETRGTAALWRTPTKGYAMIDGADKYQENGLFRQLVLDFNYTKD